MNPDLHPMLRRLDQLADRLKADSGVLAVVGVGSAGAEYPRFDDHSDIDFYVVVEDTAAKERLVESTRWLAGFGGTVCYAFRNTPDGWKALFEDGLFVEYAVVTADGLPSMAFTAERVVWSHPRFSLPVREAREPGAPDTVEHHLGEALTNLFVGLHREQRGEKLAATQFIQVYAVSRILALLNLDAATSRWYPDPLEATRRVERIRSDRQPDWDLLLQGYRSNVESASAALDWLERWYAPDEAMVKAIRALLVRKA